MARLYHSRVHPVLVRLATLSALAFLLYGGWAAWANHPHGAGAALRAFVVQGISSAITTALMGGVIERLRRPLGPTLAGTVLASLVASLAGGAFHVGLHLAAGTPEIARTVVPSVAFGYVYSVTYAVWTARPRATSAAPHATPPRSSS